MNMLMVKKPISDTLSKKLPYFFLFAFSLFFLLNRIQIVIQTDLGYWTEKAFEYSQYFRAGNLFPAFSLPHPAVSVMNIGGFFLLIKSSISHISVYQSDIFSDAFKIPFILIISLFIGYLFFLLKKGGFPPLMAFIACVLLAINRLIWQANAADILFSIFAVCSLLCFWIYLSGGTNKKGYFFLSALYCGLAIVNRFTGFILLGIIPLLFLFFKNKNKIKLKRVILKIIQWLILAVIALLILWPNFWLLSPNVKQLIPSDNYQVFGYQSENIFSRHFSVLSNLSNTFLFMPIIDFFFLILFVVFIKKNIFIIIDNKKSLNTKILLLIILMILFYLPVLILIQRVPWTFRYALPSFILLDIIIAQEIYREFIYLYHYPTNKFNLIYPYLFFLALIFFSFNNVRELLFLLRVIF